MVDCYIENEELIVVIELLNVAADNTKTKKYELLCIDKMINTTYKDKYNNDKSSIEIDLIIYLKNL